MRIDEGRDRTVGFAYAPEGQILNRRERSAASLNPEDQRYFVDGRQIGELTSDGNEDPSHEDDAQNILNIRDWTPNPRPARSADTMTGVTRGTAEARQFARNFPIGQVPGPLYGRSGDGRFARNSPRNGRAASGQLQTLKSNGDLCDNGGARRGASDWVVGTLFL